MIKQTKSFLGNWQASFALLLSILIGFSTTQPAAAAGKTTSSASKANPSAANICLSFEQYRKIVNDYFKEQGISSRFNVPAVSTFYQDSNGDFLGEIFLVKDFPKLKFVYRLNEFGCVNYVETSVRTSTVKLANISDNPELDKFDKALGYYSLGLANTSEQRQEIKQIAKGQGKGLLKKALAGLFSSKPVEINYWLYGRDYKILAYPGLFSVELKFSVTDSLASPKYKVKSSKTKK